MEYSQIIAVLFVVMVWILAVYLYRQYGAGYGTRSVLCPHMHKRARIATVWTTHNGVSSCDILQCSLLPGGKPVTCDKSCTPQLS